MTTTMRKGCGIFTFCTVTVYLSLYSAEKLFCEQYAVQDDIKCCITMMLCNIHNYTVFGKKDPPINRYYFHCSLVLFTKFSGIILHTICHYCCKFYHLTIHCSEVAQLES